MGSGWMWVNRWSVTFCYHDLARYFLCPFCHVEKQNFYCAVCSETILSVSLQLFFSYGIGTFGDVEMAVCVRRWKRYYTKYIWYVEYNKKESWLLLCGCRG
ncbi:unnamed protein product [Pylaiella littoralis]